MVESDIEFLISQYLDGTLSADEEAALLRRIESDAEARKLFTDYQRLDAALKSQPLPEMPWDELYARISAAVSEEPEKSTTSKMPWLRYGSRVAIAACLVIASVVGVKALTDREDQTTPTRSGHLPAVAMVEGPRLETPAGEAIVEIQLSPAPESVQGWRYSEVVVSRPSRVIIASGDVPRNESDSGPF